MASSPSDPSQPSTKARGDAAEAAAARFLIAHGYTVLGQQVRAGGVELDLVVRAPGEAVPTIVFVEVRARSDTRLGHALETIDASKRGRLIKGATAWLVERGLWDKVAVRFDVLALTIDLRAAGSVDPSRVASLSDDQVVWVRDAFATN